MPQETVKSLIVTIVKRGWGDRVIEASLKAGAEGGTVLFGRGVGVHEQQKIVGICIEPEKEIVFTVVPRDKAESILQVISSTIGLNKPGQGIAFVVELSKVTGVVHALSNLP